MSNLLNNVFRNGRGYVPYNNDLQSIESALGILMSYIGIPAIVYLLAVNLPRRNIPSLKLIFNLCFADLILLLNVFIQCIANRSAGGWSTGRVGCILSCTCILYLCVYSWLSIMLIGFERYLSVCKKIQLSNGRIWMLIVSNIVIPAIPVTALFLQDYGTLIDIMPAMNGCMVAWYLPQALPLAIIVGVICIISMGLLAFFYTSVYLEFRKSYKPKSSNQRSEIAVLKNCIALSLIYIVLWSGMAICVIKQLVTNSRETVLGDLMVTVMVLLNCILNPILLMIFDNRIKGIRDLQRERLAEEPQTEANQTFTLIIPGYSSIVRNVENP